MTNSEARKLVRELTNQWANEMIEAVVVGGPVQDESDVVKVKRAFKGVAIRMAHQMEISAQMKAADAEKYLVASE